MKLKGFYTSTIGSFPLDDSEANRERCLKDLISLGIDFPAYPQLTDMGKQFLDDLVKQNCGITVKSGKYVLSDSEIELSIQPPGLESFRWTIKYLKERNLKINVKAAISGPFTLASYIEIGLGRSPFNTAISNIKLVDYLAQILSESCRAASKEASMISIDEPILSVIVGRKIPFRYEEEDIVRIFNALREKCGEIPVGIHVCGRISPKLASLLLETNMDFLSHEFHDAPENLGIFSPKHLKESGKILSVGCVSSKNPYVESTKEILDLMIKFKDYGDCLIFTPDCGFRNLIIEGSKEKGYEVAIRKLRNMVEATIKFKEIILK
jgi:methionine synthase II (cobalamin-independent)